MKLADAPVRAWALPLACAMAVLAALHGMLPYAFGYGVDSRTTLDTLRHLWTTYPDWEHGMFVPLACAWLVYARRRAWLEMEVAGSVLGLPVFALACLLFWVGYVVDLCYLGFVSIQLSLAGLVIFFLGWKQMRFFLFPWLFLVFMWPLLFLDNLLSFPLRILMSGVTHEFLNAAGIANLQIGTAIVSPPDPVLGIGQGTRFALEVANPCSGIRSLFALMMLGALHAQFTQDKLWKKCFLFLCSIPLAIFGNMVRMVLLVFGTILFGKSFALGTMEQPSIYHLGAGFSVFGAALAGMFGIGWLLKTGASGCIKKAAQFFSTTKNADTQNAACSRKNAGGNEDRY